MIELKVNHAAHSKKNQGIIKQSFPQNTNEDKIHRSGQKIILNETQRNKQIMTQNVQINEQKKDVSYNQAIQNINKKTDHIRQNLTDLITEYKDCASDLFSYDPQKQKEIRKQIQKLQQEKKKRNQYIKALQQREFRTLQVRAEKQQSQIKIRKEKQKSRHRQRALLKIKALKQQALQRQLSHEKFKHYLEDYRKKKPRYQLYEEQFSQIEAKQLQKKSRILKERKNVYKPIDIEELKHFQEQYLQARQHSLNQAAEKIALQLKLTQQETKQVLSKMWKGKGYKSATTQRKSINAKKAQVLQQITKKKQYSSMIKQKYVPKIKINSGKSQQSNSDEQKQSNVKKIRKPKYLKGVNKGEIIQYRRLSLDYSQMKQKGKQYLNYVYKLPKNPNKTIQNQQTNKIVNEIKKKSLVPRLFSQSDRKNNPLYVIKRPQSIDFSKISQTRQLSSILNKMKHKDNQLQMQEKILGFQNHSNILQLQRKKAQVTSRLVDRIEQRLKMLQNL